MAAYFNHFSAIGQNLHTSLAQLVKDTAEHVKAGYQANCRVDTGYMRDSAYVVTHDSSTYSGSGDKMLPEVAHPTSDTEAIAAVGADYAMINEVGGVHHTGDGAMARAADAERGAFQSALGRLKWKA